MPIILVEIQRTKTYKDPDFMGSNPRHCPTLFTAMQIHIDLQLQNTAWPMDNERIQAQAIARDAILGGDVKSAITVLESVGCGLTISVTGTAGYVVTAAQAKAEARRYWCDHWEDNMDDDERAAFNERVGTRIRSGNSFARYVLYSDGEYHGLDVHDEVGTKVFLAHSSGCLHDDILHAFPEVAPLIASHIKTPAAEAQAILGVLIEQDRIAA